MQLKINNRISTASVVFASLVFYLCCDNTRPVIRKDKFNQLVSSVFFSEKLFFPYRRKVSVTACDLHYKLKYAIRFFYSSK